MQAVEFLVQSPPYNAGEVAGFADTIAERLIARGWARPYVSTIISAEAPGVQEPLKAEDRMSSAELVGAVETQSRARRARKQHALSDFNRHTDDSPW